MTKEEQQSLKGRLEKANRITNQIDKTQQLLAELCKLFKHFNDDLIDRDVIYMGLANLPERSKEGIKSIILNTVEELEEKYEKL